MCAEFLVVLSSSEIHINSHEHESLADAENIAALHKIARYGRNVYTCTSRYVF